MKIKKVLAFGLPVMKNMAVIAACQKTGAEFRLIRPEEAHKSIGDLAGVVGMENKPADYDSDGVSGEILIFAGFDTENLDKFLNEYRKSGIESVFYKAMLTEYNVLWSPVFLFGEMVKEHSEIESKGLNQGK